MANIDEIEARLRTVEELLQSAVVIPKYTKDVTDPSVAVGDWVLGTKAGINGGFVFFGKVNTAPPTQDSHIDNLTAF